MPIKRVFAEQTVVVTGAAGGMGLAFARRFGQAGARVAMLDVKAADVEAAAGALALEGIDTFALGCDVSDAESVASAMARVMERFGGVDVLINNAGISARAAFEATHLAVFHRVMGINFFGALYATKATLGSLKRRKGLIITISSLAGFSPLLVAHSLFGQQARPARGCSTPCAANCAAQASGVLVVCPGFTATGIGTSALDGDGSIASHPQSTVGKPATPDQVADQVFKAAQENRRMLVLTPIGSS